MDLRNLSGNTASSVQVPLPLDADFHREGNEQFWFMHRAFSATGGLAGSAELVSSLRRHFDQPLSTLARWIVAGDLVNFEWRSSIFVPLFQFDDRMLPRPEVYGVLREFDGVLSSWEAAHWFSRPNTWLHGSAPVEAIALRPSDVLGAARADRFVVRG